MWYAHTYQPTSRIDTKHFQRKVRLKTTYQEEAGLGCYYTVDLEVVGKQSRSNCSWPSGRNTFRKTADYAGSRQSESVKSQQTTVRTHIPKEDTSVEAVRGIGGPSTANLSPGATNVEDHLHRDRTMPSQRRKMF